MREKTLFFLINVMILSMIGIVFYNVLWLGFVAVIPYYFLRLTVEKQLCTIKKYKLRNEFKDVMYSFVSSFALGRGLCEGIDEASIALYRIYGKKSLLYSSLCEIVMCKMNANQSDFELWVDLVNRMDIEEGYEFLAILASCRRTGGNLHKAVESGASLICDKILVEDYISSMMRQKAFEGKIMALMPLILIIGMRIFSYDYISCLYEQFFGRVIMSIALASIIFAFVFAQKIAKIKV